MFRASKHSRNDVLQVTRVFLEASFEKKEVAHPSGSRIVMQPCVVDLSSEEVEKKLPLPDDYSLSSLLAAGLPLREVNTLSLQSDSAISEKLAELDSTFEVVEPQNQEQ